MRLMFGVSMFRASHPFCFVNRALYIAILSDGSIVSETGKIPGKEGVIVAETHPRCRQATERSGDTFVANTVQFSSN